jgi:hypothetical protein
MNSGIAIWIALFLNALAVFVVPSPVGRFRQTRSRQRPGFVRQTFLCGETRSRPTTREGITFAQLQRCAPRTPVSKPRSSAGLQMNLDVRSASQRALREDTDE